MIRKILTYLAVPVIATAVLLVTTSPALAQRGGHGGGGFHAGGYHGGYGGYHGGYGGYRGYYGGYGGYRGYYGGYRGYNVRPYYYGNWYYPYYGSGYYPYYGYGSSYYPYYGIIGDAAPSSSDTTSTSATLPAQTAAADTATTFISTKTRAQNGSASASLLKPNTSVSRPSVEVSRRTTGSADTAIIIVVLSDQAELYFDNQMTTAMGTVRAFTTPTLTAGQKYTYSLRARWLDEEVFRDQTQSITFTAGDRVVVRFRNPPGVREGAEGPFMQP
jgi:uncharacterized protein (TIGR03000 family)